MHCLSCWAIIYLFTSYEVDVIKLFYHDFLQKNVRLGSVYKNEMEKNRRRFAKFFSKANYCYGLKARSSYKNM